ncbi:MAG: hypothetical protein KTR31_27470 [Myxococcales bacterium]|nr:hypothetical protein [Myxococcales bacterium]
MHSHLALVVLGTTAQARAPDCTELLNVEVEQTLDEIHEALRAKVLPRARRLLESTHPRLPCLSEVVRTDLLARYAQQRAAVFALDIDMTAAERWARLARTLDPETSWDAYLPPVHPSRPALDAVEPAVRMTVPDRGLAVGDGAAFLDGRYLTLPQAEVQMPHLLQVGDAYGRLTASAWQEGASFPGSLLTHPTALPSEPPAWVGLPPDSLRRPKPLRSRRLRTAAGLGLTSGTLLGTAWLARSAYVQRPSDGLRTVVNGTTAASLVSGVASLGVLGLGVATRR